MKNVDVKNGSGEGVLLSCSLINMATIHDLFLSISGNCVFLRREKDCCVYFYLKT